MYLQFNKKKGKNNKVYSSVLLCEKYRENGAVKTKVVICLNCQKKLSPPLKWP